MAIVQRANVILKINDSQVDRFLDDGYNLIDETGKVLKASVPTDVGTLQKAYGEQRKRIEELEAQLKELKEKKVAPVKEEQTVDDVKPKKKGNK